MCGIAGGWYRTERDNDELATLADSMLNAIAHRGPDDGGYVSNNRLFLGNRRLKIFDLSGAGNQPFFSDDGGIWLVFNGEIYNHYELRAELEGSYNFHSHTDTEVLLHAYEKWGMDCLDKLNGMFAFALWDDHKQSLYLCRDRLGIKPLYYHCSEDALLFASEIKSILVAGVERHMDRSVIRDYLTDGFYDHTNRTFFEGIRQLKAGSFLTITESGKAETLYWNPIDELLGREPDEQVLPEYWDTLEDAIKLRMRADVPYAVMLSGGLDSSVIAALADAHLDGETLNTMTVRYPDPKYDEGSWADHVAEGRAWNRYSTVIDSGHVTSMFQQAMWHQDEPFGSVALFGDMVLSELARKQGIYVLLEGQGADETLAGYEYYYIHRIIDLMKSDPSAARRSHREYALRRGIKDDSVDAHFDQLVSTSMQAGKRLGQDGTLPVRPDAISPSLEQAVDAGFAIHQTGTAIGNTCYNDLTSTKLPRVLRFKDRSSMMHGIELRVPFLDHRLVELSQAIPTDCLIDSGYTKFCLRKKMANRLPTETCFHVKRQIQTPQREWLRTLLKPTMDEIMHSQSFAGRDILNMEVARKLYDDYVDHPQRFPNGFFVWQWLSIEQWARTFLDQTSLLESIPRPPNANLRRYPPVASS